MDIDTLKALLTDVYDQKVRPEEALERLRRVSYEDLGFAQVNHHRPLRWGFPEVIYCQGKTVEQVTGIARSILAQGENLLATRADVEIFAALKALDERAEYNELGRTVTVKVRQKPASTGVVLVICAGTSDIPVAEEAAVTAGILGSRAERLYDVGVAGIHRLLDKREMLYRARVIVVVAGMEGALASVVGGLVDTPVIAVPTSIGYGASFNGIAALLSMLNTCASGVATVNIDNGFGAGCMAHIINMLGERAEDTDK